MTEHTPRPTAAPLSERQLRSLLANLNANRVSGRKQGGRTLSYLEAWDVRAALIKVFGFGGFSATADEARVINTESVMNSQNKPNVRITVMCRMTLVIPQLGATYSEYAASSQQGNDPGEVLDFAIKTAESDALKRCAINLGTQFGLSLYNDGKTEDVIRVVLAPGQEWPRPQQQEPAGAQVVQNVLGGQQTSSEPAPGVTPEQHAANQALLDRALNMKAEQQAGQEAGQEDTGPAVLGPDADTNGQ